MEPFLSAEAELSAAIANAAARFARKKALRGCIPEVDRSDFLATRKWPATVSLKSSESLGI